MSQNVAEFVWKRLNEWGLSRVYGYPGDGVGGLDVALGKAKDFMDYVQVRHEEMAASWRRRMRSSPDKWSSATRYPVLAPSIC